MNRIRGIALVQALIIAMVLSLFGLILSQSLQKQVRTTFDIQKSFDNRVLIENAKAQLIFALLTENKSGRASDINSIAKRWNFYGEPFELENNIKVTLQDLRSLISLNITDKILATEVLGRLGMPDVEQQIFIDSLSDWKDKDDLSRLNGAESSFYNSKQLNGPRNGYLQSLSEVIYIRAADNLPLEQWKKYFSIQFVSDFNPLNAPELILKALIKDNSVVQEVLRLRAEKKLNHLTFFQLTGIDEDEFISFATGKIFRVNMELKDNGIKVSHQFVIIVEPTNLHKPVVMTNVTWNRK